MSFMRSMGRAAQRARGEFKYTKKPRGHRIHDHINRNRVQMERDKQQGFLWRLMAAVGFQGGISK